MAELPHLDAQGAAHMVDVSGKSPTRRLAEATGRIRMSSEALQAIVAGSGPKGDVFATARIAGIMATKRTADLIPMCHVLALESATVDFEVGENSIQVTCRVGTTGKTGAEMEAMTGASIALLTIYDMAKAIDRGMVIEEVRLIAKSGGKSGEWRID